MVKMNKNRVIYESVLDDWDADSNPTASNVIASKNTDSVYPCQLRIGIGVTDKGADKHYIEWMKIEQYRVLWKNFINELFELLTDRSEIYDIRCSKYMFVDVHMDLDSDEDDEVYARLDDVQPVFDKNRLYYENDRDGAVFCIDVYMDAGFKRTRQCVTLVKQLFNHFSQERASESGGIFWVNSMCAGMFRAIGWNAFNMEKVYWGGKLAEFCRGLIGMCETGEAGKTNVHCYTDIERLFKFNERNQILKYFEKVGSSDNYIKKICSNVPLKDVKFSVVTLYQPKGGNGLLFPQRWIEYNSATNEIDSADLFCEWSLSEAEQKCLIEGASALKASESICDVYVYNSGGRPFGLLYINYDQTVIIDDEEYIVLLTSKYYKEDDEEQDNACAIEMIDDMNSIGIGKDEALKILDDAGIEYFKY